MLDSRQTQRTLSALSGEARRLHSALEEKENAKLQLEALEGQNRLLDNKLAEVESQVLEWEACLGREGN
jgi:hypothetical protein